MNGKPRSHQLPLDSPDYVTVWARDLVTAIGKREARRILEDFRTLAENKRATKADRAVAAERVKALERLM